MKVRILKSNLSGNLSANPSKSYEQRLLAGALLSKKQCEITNYGNSDDVIIARKIINNLGCDNLIENNTLKTFQKDISNSKIIDCNESALCARLFTPITCLFKEEFIINGQNSLLNRPIANGFSIFEQMGCNITHVNLKPPIHFSKAKLKSGSYIIDGSKTSQLISGLIMSLPIADGDSNLYIKSPASINYIFISIDIVKSFGILIEHEFDSKFNLIINIKGNQKYVANNFEVEGDWSSMAFTLVAGALCGNISINGLNKYSIQADKNILDVFDLANIKYNWTNKTLYVEKSNINAFEFDAKDCPDLIPVLVILALFANGKSKIYGAKRLLYKESSRGEVLVRELTKINADIKLTDNLIEINGKQTYKTSTLNSHNDHRIAMALSIIGLVINDGIEIENYESIAKSYPNFYNDLKNINASFVF